MRAAEAEDSTQLLLVFRLPENPSRYRVSVWRRLKRMQARSIHRTLFVLPDTPLNRLRSGDLAHDVENWGGSTWIFSGTVVSSARPKASGSAVPSKPRARTSNRHRPRPD